MPFAAGHRLGPYEVVAPLGAGGMGEVYRARDAKLGRDVALKVLPESLSTNSDYITRFQREAQVLATLNHPNIAAIYGLEDRAIVMELVEGLTLGDRIAQGPIPLDEAITYARQIADALEYAHEKGIIHRDLKPANVKITPDGNAKVLDFGLAKIAEKPKSDTFSMDSPTLTATQSGLILGTAAYMAPEQARGYDVDRRADIWAFGAVLYEMLTAKMAFPGESVTDILASVVKLEPDWSALPPATPPAIRKLVTRCLVKDRKRRLQAIGEARLAIDEYLGDPSGVESVAAAPLPEQRSQAWPWIALAAVLFVICVALSLLHFREAAPAERVLRYTLAAPDKADINTFALSPDGRYLAIAATVDGTRRLFLRPMDALAAQELRATESATYPFWSPDGRAIGFFADGKLKRIATDGTPPQTLCDAPEGRGGSWNRDGVIVFASNTGAVQRVAAVGGVPVPVTKAISEGTIHRFPIFLSDGQRFLYHAIEDDAKAAGIFVGSLDSLPGRRLLAEDSSVLWIAHPSRPGTVYLLFHRDRTLVAQPFEESTLQPSGELFPVAEQVALMNRQSVQASVASSGLLVFLPGGAFGGSQQVRWYDRSGKLLSNVGPPATIPGLALSPDEKVVAIARASPSDIWVHEFARGIDSRFTFDATQSRAPVWSPDGRRIAYSSNRSGTFKIYLKDTSGSGKDELLLPGDRHHFVCDWSKDGRTILFAEAGSNVVDLLAVPVDGQRKPVAVLDSHFGETQGQFSPDGRWVAYASSETGRYEVYVRSYPSDTGKWKVSNSGGEFPRWRADGRELFYVSPDRRVMAAALKVVPGPPASLSVDAPQRVLDVILRTPNTGSSGFPYSVSSDGKRLLVVANLGVDADTPLTVVVNWLAAVKQ